MMENYSVQYYLTYCAASFSCGLLMAFMYAKMLRHTGTQEEIRAFRKMIFAEIAIMVSESLWCFSMLGLLPVSRAVLWAVNAADLIASACALYFVMGYAGVKMCPLHEEERSGKIWKFLRVLPLVVDIALNLISAGNGWIFYLDEAGIYHRGTYYFLHVLCTYFYFAASLLIIAGSALRFPSRRKPAGQMTVFIMIIVCGGILQVFVGRAPFVILTSMMDLFYLFVIQWSGRINTDPLTGLNNRSRSHIYLEKRMKTAGSRPFYLIMADINHFKKINDTYGHVTGDNALRAVSLALKRFGNAHPKSFLSRYGGDEFLIAIDEDECSPEEFRRDLSARLDQAMKEGGMDFVLRLSQGASLCNQDHMDLMCRLKEADHHLYEEKERLAGEEKGSIPSSSPAAGSLLSE
jgi:diguanylate cyclase (GGDEF)-like protein